MKNSTKEIWPGENWNTSIPEDQGVSSDCLNKMLAHIRDKNLNINGLLIVKSGYLITEEYFFCLTRNSKHALNSCTKSIISVLIGIAIEEGYIKSVNEKVFDYFKGIEIENEDEKKESLTIKHLLTMTTGFKFKEPDLYFIKQDGKTQLKRALDMPTEKVPGIAFKYFNGASHMLSAIIQRATGMKTFKYAKEKLFNPLGMSSVTWEEDKDGINFGCSGIYMTLFDMTKLGYLLLRKGRWREKQIVSKLWVEEATGKHIDTENTIFGAYGYGYQWWQNSFGGYSARGFGGQYIFVIPEADMVAVFTGNLAKNDFLIPENLLETYVYVTVPPEKYLQS